MQGGIRSQGLPSTSAAGTSEDGQIFAEAATSVGAKSEDCRGFGKKYILFRREKNLIIYFYELSMCVFQCLKS